MNNNPELSPIQQELLNRADSIIKGVSDTIAKGADIAQQQLPDIAQQYLEYSRVSYSVLMISIIIILIVFWTIVYRCRSHFDDGESGVVPLLVISGVFINIFSFITFCTNISNFLKVWFAPKIYLLETVVHLLK